MAIRHKRKSTAAYTWLSTDLVDGQIGLNTADGTLHFKKTDTSIVELGETIAAANVEVVNTAFDVLTATNAQDALEETDAALRLARGTGITFGGEITINAGNPQRIDIAAGAGQILNDVNPIAQTYLAVSWAAITAQTITNTGITWFYFDDNSGAVKQTQTEPTVENRRIWIVLGRVTVAADLSIAGIAQDRDFVQQLPVQLREVADALGLLKLEGLFLTANGSNLLLNMAAGKIFDYGSNGRLSPHSKEFLDNNGFTFQYVKRTTDAALQVDRTTIDPNNYDLAGTITAVTTNRFTIQDIYLFPSGNIRIQYGQSQYTSLAGAVEAISTRSFVKNPNLSLGVRVGFLVVQQGTTALNSATQAAIINANKFGEVGGGVTAAVADYLIASNNLSDLADVSVARTNLGLAIGTNVQAFDADLSSWAAITRAPGFDTFATTPSSANFAALVTGETGSGALVFATSPTLVTPVLGVASGTSLLLSSGTGLQVGSSIPFSDAAGVLTLQNVDALDATTTTVVRTASEQLLEGTAGLAIDAYRIVTIDPTNVILADNTVAGHANRAIGLQRTSVANGGAVSAPLYGKVTNGAWNWTLGTPIWLGTAGNLTQTAPVAGSATFSRIVAQVLTATTIDFRPQAGTVFV